MSQVLPKTILLVEDNTEDQLAIKRCLERNSVTGEVSIAINGESALKYIESVDSNSMPHLVLLDYKLPGISGIEVLKVIRQHPLLKFVPIVILSSLISPEAIEEAYECGVNSVIIKPHESDQFSEVVLNTVMYWLLVNRTSSDATDISSA